MTAIRIVTDSTADLPLSLVARYGIGVVPLTVIFGEETYRDGVDLSSGDFYRRLVSDPRHPHTSQPSPAAFAQEYQRMSAEGAERLLVFSISSRLSGTYQAAVMASQMVDIPVDVIDTEQASLAMGWMVLTAAQAAESGASAEDILKWANDCKQRTSLLFVVDTLEYLKRNGRIGKASAMLGTLLSVKPILSLIDGVVTPVDKVRGSSKAIGRMVEICSQRHAGQSGLRIGILHAASPEPAAKLAETIHEALHPEEILISEIGPVLGAHAGPNAVGVAIVPR
ncbi:MAG: DegV family protein [Bacillota bacterium]